MKLLIIPALMLSACTTPALNPVTIAQTVPAVARVCEVGSETLIDEKTLLAAQILYNVPAQAYVSARNNGKLTPAMRDLLRPKLIKLYSLLQSVKAAKGTVNCDYSSMIALRTEILTLLK